MTNLSPSCLRTYASNRRELIPAKTALSIARHESALRDSPFYLASGSVDYRGHTFNVKIIPDDTGMPWEEFDSLAEVKRCRDEDRPNGWLWLSKPGRHCHGYAYDIAGAIRECLKWEKSRDRAEAIARQEAERFAAYIRDDWNYCTVLVTLESRNKVSETVSYRCEYYDSLGGIESDCSEYIAEVAQELADNILSAMGE